MTTAAAHARSLLFVPGDRPDRFDKAAASGADAIIIDLEDAVAADQKETALRNAVTWLESGREAIVRINAAGTSWHAGEVQALTGASATIMVPKSQSAHDLERVAQTSGSDVIALIETARGVRDADEIASAAGVVRLALGNVDLSAELGTDPASHPALAYSRGRLVVASAAAGITAPIDGVTTAVDAPDVLAADLRVTRELGFGGKMCIHPRQVRAVSSALAPSEADVAWAERILSTAPADGVGVVDGLMVDPPVLRRAERILAARRS
jgi:citrate lyase subunit beta / citryl-CoA lyase